MNKILVTLLALIGGSCISFAQMETGRVSDTAEDTLRIENEIVAVDTGFYQSVVRYDTVRYNGTVVNLGGLTFTNAPFMHTTLPI